MSEIIDNRSHRVRTLKTIIQQLHAGVPAEQVRRQMAEIVGQTDYSEIVSMEQELIADGVPVEQIQGMCDLHSQVTRDILVQLPPVPLAAGHPAETLRTENEALRATLARMRAAIAAVEAMQDESDASSALLAWRQAFNELMDIEKHYQRKEHTFFSKLETHGILGPSKVMWGKDDEVRALLKELGLALREQAPAGEWKLIGSTVAATAIAAVEEMIYKENQILLPMCLEVFTADDWAEIWNASPRYGWCLVEPGTAYRPATAVPKEGLRLAPAEAVQMPTGALSLEQLTALFSTLPVDLTFVDADDRVAFFSEGPQRVFARSRAVVGRKVQHCHPPRSVSTVDRILEDFRGGSQVVAEFWISFQGRFVHIRYFAVRGTGGAYLGTLEVTQDVGSIRALQGERRLLEYERKDVA